MKIMSSDKLYDSQFTLRDNVFISIDMGRTYERKLAMAYSKLNDADSSLCSILRTFNKSIESVDSAVQQYVVQQDYFDNSIKHIRLPFTNLCTGERLFTICHMAHSLNKHIVVCRELSQLDMPHIKMFFKMWGNSQYIDIMIPSNLCEYLLIEAYNKYVI